MKNPKSVYFLHYGRSNVSCGNVYSCVFTDAYSAQQESEQFLESKKYDWAYIKNQFGQVVCVLKRCKIF